MHHLAVRLTIEAYGSRCPQQLIWWLNRKWSNGLAERDKELRVTLGPGSSFIAWDTWRIRWHALPSLMESRIQNMLTPNGWRNGPPVIAALGCHESWVVLFQQLRLCWWIPSGYLPKSADASKEFDRKFEQPSDYSVSRDRHLEV